MMQRIENSWLELDRWENEGGSLLAVARTMPAPKADLRLSGMGATTDMHRVPPVDGAAGRLAR